MSVFLRKCNRFLKTTISNLQHQNSASLYAPSSIGIDRYEETRKKVANQFARFDDKYRKKMSDFISGNDNNMIFTDDLKNMIHLSTKEDCPLIEQMIIKYKNQKRELQFGNFVFGPVVMRMYYHLDLPDQALKMFMNPDTFEFFDQLMSHQIMMDLLFKHERYDDVITVFNMIKENGRNPIQFSKNVIILLMATCYKQNTKESLDFGKQVWSNLMESGHEPLRKAITFLAALAINQGAPHVSLELLSSVREQKYVTVLNLKAMALADLDRPDDALPLLRSILDIDVPHQINYAITPDTIEKLKTSVERFSNKQLQREFEVICKGLHDRNFIVEQMLDSILCQPIVFSGQVNRDNRINNMNDMPTKTGRYSQRRPGLRDMV